MAKKNNRPTFLERLVYKFDETLSKGSLGLIAWLIIFTFIIIVIASYILYTFQTEPRISSFLSLVWTMLNRSLDPGYLGTDKGNFLFITMSFFITLFGILFVSILIGLIIAALERRLYNLKRGRSRVVESDHIVILGWSEKILPIIRELYYSAEEALTTVVILGEKDKVEMEEVLFKGIKKLNNIKIVCRRGITGDLHSAEITNLNAAKSIILLAPDNSLSDIEVIKNLLAIINNPSRRKEPYNIVAEIKNPHNVHLAKMLGREEVSIVSSTNIITDLIVQTSKQSGLSEIYDELLSFVGNEFYISEFSDHAKLYGMKFRKISHSFQNTTIIGILNEDNKNVIIAPHPDMVFEQGQKLILLGESRKKLLKVFKKDYQIDQTRFLQSVRPKKLKKENILILGWHPKVIEIIRKMDRIYAKDSIISLATNVNIDPDILREIETKLINIKKIKVLKTDITDWDCLMGLELQSFDKIIIVSEREESKNFDRDAKTLILLLHIRGILKLLNVRRQIITEMRDIQNKELAETIQIDDFIVSNQFISRIIAQYAETPSIRETLNSLLDLNGINIEIRPLVDYIQGNNPVNYHTIIGAAFEGEEIIIGYQVVSEINENKENYGIYLNPSKTIVFDHPKDINLIIISGKGRSHITDSINEEGNPA